MPRILIIDDMAVLREPVAAALKNRQYDVECATNGREGLDRINKAMPDLILLDVAMPVMDGMAFLRALRKHPRGKTVPVILLTAVGDRDYVIEAGRLGAKDYMLKSSFSLDELYRRIEKHLGSLSESQPEDSEQPDTQPHQPVKREERDPIEIPDARPINTSDSSHDERIATLKSLTPVVSRSEIKEYIDTSEDLRGFSPTVAVLLKATRDPHCTIDHIVKLASGDHALALKLLKLANSAAFNRGEPADSVRKAILRIGLDRLRHAVLTIGVIEHFSDTRYGEQIHLGKFWEHSISCALIAAELAAEVETVDADVAFTMGLLHDVGRLLLAEQLGDRYKDVMATADTLRLPFEQVEGRMLHFTHADVMDRALHRWQFPQQITNPVVFHHLSANNLRIQMRSGLDEAAVLALANRLSHAMLLGSSGNDFVYPTEDICELLRLDGRQLQRIEAEAPGKSLDIKLSLLAQSPHANWTHVRDEYADQVNPDARIHFISSQPGVDAYRILCTSLLDRHKTEGEAADSMETPNCIVMHIASGREISDLCDKFITMERQWQLPQPLPLVIISPKGRMKLDSRLLVPERNLQYLPQPLHVGTYVEAINRAVATQTDRAAA